MDIRIEVDDDHLVIVLPTATHQVITEYQDAWHFGTTLERAAGDIAKPTIIVDSAELNKVKVMTLRRRYVVLVFGHTDRIKLSSQAAITLARTIRRNAQSLHHKMIDIGS